MVIRFLAVFIAVATAAAAAEPSAPAPAAGTQAPADEKKPAVKVRAVVHLRDGGLVRGTVRRLKLGKSITLTLQSGKPITLDDEDVITIELFGGAAPADAGTPQAAAAGAGAFPEQTVRAPSRSGPAAAAEPASKKSAAPAAAAAGAAGAGAVRPPALPQPPPASELDSVYLADGGLLRGTIESEKPDLVLRLVSGRKRTLAAREVKSIARHGAPAAAAATDAVWLKDGTVLRGAIESDTNDVVIRLLSGRKRTVPSASVQRVDRGKKP